MEQALRFKAMYTQLGFSVADVAKFLQVTPRTVQGWISGRVRIPYAAYKLLRLQLHYELPGDAWNGWTLSAGRLYTPEGHELHPRDFSWWSLLVRKAAMFSTLYAQNAMLTQQHRAGRTALGEVGLMRSVSRPRPAKFGPTDAVGRPAQPAGLDLSNKHFRTMENRFGGVPQSAAAESVARSCHVKKSEVSMLSRGQRLSIVTGRSGDSGPGESWKQWEARMLSTSPARRLVQVARVAVAEQIQVDQDTASGWPRKPYRPSDASLLAIWDQALADRLSASQAASQPSHLPLTRQQRRQAARQLDKLGFRQVEGGPPEDLT